MRVEVRVKVFLIKELKWELRVQKFEGERLFKWPIMHVGIGTTLVLPLFSLWVPIPISVVPVPIWYCINFQP